MKVCEKVQRKGVTSYNEVADELVNEFSDPRNLSSPSEAVSCLYFAMFYCALNTIFSSPGQSPGRAIVLAPELASALAAAAALAKC